MKIICVVGARPNFIKMAPVVDALRVAGLAVDLIHTGQHYDRQMSEVFFQQLGMPRPSVNLAVGSGSHAEQTAKVMTEFEPVCANIRPDLVLVAGDVNSTVACGLVAAKLGIPVGHVEAGLRSFDRRMPEEINRVLTDHLSSLLFTTEESGNFNLRKEGISASKIHFVGNTMIDTLMKNIDQAIGRKPWESLGLEPRSFGLVTLHRPSNVDDVGSLKTVEGILNGVSDWIDLVFPVHPRTRSQFESSGVSLAERVRLVDPLPYLDFLGLMAKAAVVLTDSGGIQEETTALGVPCLTMRENTERPSTIESGSNRLVGTEKESVIGAVNEILDGQWKVGQVPPLWDGRAAGRLANAIVTWNGRVDQC